MNKVEFVSWLEELLKDEKANSNPFMTDEEYDISKVYIHQLEEIITEAKALQ